jgi:hypothetical protein
VLSSRRLFCGQDSAWHAARRTAGGIPDQDDVVDYLKRFPQPARVGDLIGMSVLDLNSKTLGSVRRVVRNPAGETQFIVDCSRWWGWFGRPVAVPLEALGIEGGHLVSLDMTPSEYAAAPTWHDTEGTGLPNDATVLVALSRS